MSRPMQSAGKSGAVRSGHLSDWRLGNLTWGEGPIADLIRQVGYG
jgi:hypothetical protein